MIVFFKQNQSDPKDFRDTNTMPTTKKHRAKQSHLGCSWDTNLIMLQTVRYSKWNENGNKYEPPNLS